VTQPTADSPTLARIRALFPFLAWERPTLGSLRSDALAGLSVGLVLVPQALAYATIAGMPPQAGLYAALLPAVVGALWGSSPLLAVGPVALTSLLSFASLQPLASPGTADWVNLAMWLAIWSGAIQFVLGAFRLGIIANFVSYPVIAGFVNAAAVTIILSQVPPLLGLPPPHDLHWFERAEAALAARPALVAETAAFGLGSILLLWLQRRVAPRVPGVLVVCVVGILASAVVGFGAHGGAIAGEIPGGWPPLAVPAAIGLPFHRALLPAALIVALLSFTEAMSSCRTLARQRGEVWNQNQELVGQGLAKIASGLSGAFPVSGSFSRSALNLYVGAKSAWSTLFTVVVVLACLLWATPYLYHLPLAVLAAVIIVPLTGLLDFAVFRTLWRASVDDGAIALLTFAATLASVPYVHWGVLTGFLVSLLAYLYRRSRPRIIEVGPHADGTLRDRGHHRLPHVAPDVLAVRMDAAITYISAPLLERFILERLHPRFTTVLIAASPVNDVDATGVEMLRQLHARLAAEGVALKLAGVKKQLHEVLSRTRLAEELGPQAFYPTDRAAIEALAERDVAKESPAVAE
jgi:SulP family sulfate permease